MKSSCSGSFIWRLEDQFLLFTGFFYKANKIESKNLYFFSFGILPSGEHGYNSGSNNTQSREFLLDFSIRQIKLNQHFLVQIHQTWPKASQNSWCFCYFDIENMCTIVSG